MNWKDEIKRFYKEEPMGYFLNNDISRFELENFIESLLKQQRVNCSRFLDSVYDSTEWRDTRTLRNVILNAPEPEGINKEK